ncbi:hypothetical protein Kpol_2001p33 [Vanderwaltozyma polyspora DSM 70294]|uniref:Tr-type G domain-containing protein n=1 Tax=Vanderwaltozyma polyspora (strain ATCC 22028 / DSM 70294 / BCRC 21397 / CBS 2163 / NBRC 10782 / NRRL Y-8283 / UCD 57-17) TaxID=436907 RepID=A7TGR5_VANPO|nr:uncharacterized protein Kpol_2001p33 [Vanderwaltozyma polyspora DSM 70294]EDO18528.1 hypothetical protein Kpol_2001p33 [Vanderwaltozyma polyspora DSM 70294]
MDEDLYDEFGNLVGEQLVDSDDEDFEVEIESNKIQELGDEGEVLDSTESTSLIERQFGDEVEILVETEDIQEANVPLVEPSLERTKAVEHAIFNKPKEKIPKCNYDREYLKGTLNIPERIKNVVIIGSLHSGKTSLLDTLILDEHKLLNNSSKNIKLGWKPLKYTDNLKQEVDRGLSLKINGFTMLGTDLNDKSVALNILDTPGHVNFFDEVAVGLAVSEYAIVCIDVVEGITSVVGQLIQQCQNRGLEMIFVLNKIDRLIIELKLPPMDAYLKLNHIVGEINSYTKKPYSPSINNIVFASAKLGFTFTIREFIKYYYSEKLPTKIVVELEKKLWGNYYYSDGKIKEGVQDQTKFNTFVEFILLPIYKIFIHTLANDPSVLSKLLKYHFSIKLDENALNYDSQPLLRYICNLIFKKQSGLIQSIVELPDTNEVLGKKKSKLLRGDIHDENTTILAHCIKNMDIDGFEWSMLRIYKGNLEVGSKVRVIDSSNLSASENEDGEIFEVDAEEFPLIEISEIGLLCGRFIISVQSASCGQIVLVKGISSSFAKTATIYNGSGTNIPIFKEIDYINEPIFKVIIEPMKPSELSKLLDGLNKIGRTYPGIVMRVEESGEHVLIGFGELYLDCFLSDLRNKYSGIEIKVSNPMTVFSESCSGESLAAIPVHSSSNNVTVSVSAKPLELSLLKDLTKNRIPSDIFEDRQKLSKLLRTDYDWDSLEARNLWSFYHCNAFVDDTLPDEVDKTLVESFRRQICQGFYWATREGPLAEEPIHGVQFKLLQLSIDNQEDRTVGTQLIPLLRKACYVALLTAVPTFLEPIYEVNVIVHNLLIPIVEELFNKRRGGRIYRMNKIVATPFTEIRAQLPVIESVGFETDLRLSTEGKAMCQLHFWNKIWRKVPGDVMDEDAPIPKLRPAPYNSLSRDFVMKTRRRKGISNAGFMSNDGPTLEKFIDADLFEQLKENDLV